MKRFWCNWNWSVIKRLVNNQQHNFSIIELVMHQLYPTTLIMCPYVNICFSSSQLTAFGPQMWLRLPPLELIDTGENRSTVGFNHSHICTMLSKICYKETQPGSFYSLYFPCSSVLFTVASRLKGNSVINAQRNTMRTLIWMSLYLSFLCQDHTQACDNLQQYTHTTGRLLSV